MKRIFSNPWWIVFGSALALIVGNGPVVVFTFGVFLKPVIDEFGWNRGTVSGALTAYTTIGALATPLAGKLVDRFGVRRVTLIFIALFSLFIAALSQTPSYPAVFLLLYGLCGLFGSGQAPLPYAKAISRRFEARRGLALGIALAGVGIGTAMMPQLARVLIQSFGWRGAYVGLGMFTFALAFTCVFLFVREPNESSRRPVESGHTNVPVVPGMTVAETLKGSFRFWFLAIAVFLVALVTNGILTHIVPLLTDRGLSTQLASLVLTSSGLAMIAGRVLSGYLLDRIFAPYVAVCFFLVTLVGVALLGSGWGGIVPLLGAICAGLGLASEMDLMAFLVGRYFGLRAYGEIYGYVMAVFLFGAGLGPWIMGVSFDATRSYNPAFAGFGMALLLASLLICRLGPYTYPITTTVNVPSSTGASAF